ncbi:hypothetical protein [Nocardia carnea]|uniref:Uncharacterized protein n=1 Tax=Nocardia carnea TaxID=37328 RepID=A0ABW7TEZ6_9NOCA|nr:hypothetical protein [Nocardia carnea]
MTLNQVCQQCNSGWLNDLENAVTPILQKLSHFPFDLVDPDELKNLGFWAYIRALIRTRISPRGHAPDSMFEDAHHNRRVPRGSYIQLGWCTHYVFEAGAHQSVFLDGTYVAHVAFGLGGHLFLVSMTEGEEMLSQTLDVSRQPRLWFPGALHWLSPTENFDPRRIPRILTAQEAIAVGLTLPIRMGVNPLVDNFGKVVDPTVVIPAKFHPSLAWDNFVDGHDDES